MLGYHFTTLEAYETIAKKGLILSPIGTQHHEGFHDVMHLLQNGAIWIYKRPQKDTALLAMIIYVACEYNTKKVCLLEIEYEKSQSAGNIASLRDIIHLYHTLTLGFWGHVKEPIELLIKPMPPEKIKLLRTWNLEDWLK